MTRKQAKYQVEPIAVGEQNNQSDQAQRSRSLQLFKDERLPDAGERRIAVAPEGGTAGGRRFSLKAHAFLGIALVAFILAILVINPLRETALEDDWAYALTVQHLLETGQYRLHDWAAANMPFQVYWGGLWSQLLGYSHSSLRIATLVFVFIGLVAFYFLAKEHALSRRQAGLLTLCLLASPLLVRFSFNFMTDAPFLMCLILALFLYTRALRLHSYKWMLLASIAGSATILIRQFGVALIPGLVALWMLRKAWRREALFFLAGIVLPLAAITWQLAIARLAPNWGATLRLRQQTLYFADSGLVLTNLLWRPTAILQYLALFSLPLVFLALLSLILSFPRHICRRLLQGLLAAGIALSVAAIFPGWPGIEGPIFAIRRMALLTGGTAVGLVSWRLLRRSPDFTREPSHNQNGRPVTFPVMVLIVFALYIVAGIVYGHFGKHLAWLMPYLAWNFEAVKSMGPWVRGVLTLITSLGAILFGAILVFRYSAHPIGGEVTSQERLLDLVTFFLVAQHLIFAVFGDEYLLVCLPFGLIVAGRHLRAWLDRFSIPVAVTCLGMLAASALWTRGLLAEAEAFWKGGESLRSTGVSPRQIDGSWTWNCFHGAFDDYLAEKGDHSLDGNIDLQNPEGDGCADFFDRWLPERRKRARFLIASALDEGLAGNREVIHEIPYRDMLFRRERVYVLRKYDP